MRSSLILTVLGFLTLATSTAWCDERPKFDDVAPLDVPGWGRIVYVIVLTDQQPLAADLDKLVVRYAKAGLEVATKYQLTGTPTADPQSKLRGNIAFAVRGKGSYPGVEYNISGFDVGQLQEIVAASEAEGLKLASFHNWSPGQVRGNAKPEEIRPTVPSGTR